MSDPQRFRITWICKCSTDYAEGYGSTLDEARDNVRAFWRKGGHRPLDVQEEVIEHAVSHPDGGSHYEPV